MEIQKLINQYVYWPEIDNTYQKNIQFSDTPIGTLLPIFKPLMTQSRTHVTDDIIRFYGLNEMLSKVRQDSFEILDEKALNLYRIYRDEINEQSKKMLAYLSTICLMEARFTDGFDKANSIARQYTLDSRFDYSNYDTLREEYEGHAQRFREEYALMIAEMKPDIDTSKFTLFIEMLHTISYDKIDRHEIKEEMLHILAQKKYASLTIGEILEFSQILFNYNDFARGFGGQSWEKIAQHALDFVQGKINAEVFLDQAFSLEHNSGQIFNKNVIYNVAEQRYWKMGWINEQFSYYNVIMTETNFLLNAQHQGFLLSFANTQFDYEDVIGQIPQQIELYKKYNTQLNLEQRQITPRAFYETYSQVQQNVLLLKEFSQGFHERNADFKQLLTEHNVIVPDFDFAKALENGKNMDGGIVKITPERDEFCQFINRFNKPNRPTRANLIEVSKLDTPYVFSAEVLDTATVSHNQLNREYLGNKAFGLAQMQNEGLPVPRAMVFPTGHAQSYFNEKDKWLSQAGEHFQTIIEKFQTHGYLKPFSVRSGAAVSMPGMMDTILNVGIDDSNYEALCEKMGQNVVNESVLKFMTLFTQSVFHQDIVFSRHFNQAMFEFRRLLDDHGIEQNFDTRFPLSAKAQLRYCLEGVFISWQSERAKAYREHHGISDDIGTAAIVQEMVFGNLNEQSCTGVLFSRDCINGNQGMIGEYLVNAQGEDVVSGAVTPQNIREMKNWNPQAYQQLTDIAQRLEEKSAEIQDIEFTIENGELYILQKRKAVCSSHAAFKLSQELYSEGKINKEDMLKSMSVENLLTQTVLDNQEHQAFAQGLVGNPGVIRGIVVRSEEDIIHYSELYTRTYMKLAEQDKHEHFGWIFVANETSPEHISLMLKTEAFLTANGGFTSHAAILARSWNKPCIVGAGSSIENLASGEFISCDAYSGKIYQNVLDLKSINAQQAQDIASDIVEQYNINLSTISTAPKHTIFHEPFWTEKFQTHIVLEQEKKKNFTHFLSLSQRVAIMLLKEQSKLPSAQKVKNRIQEQRDKTTDIILALKPL